MKYGLSQPLDAPKERRPLDFFGEMLEVIIEFGQSGFDMEREFRDWVQSEDMVPGEMMFTQIGDERRWMLSEASMLADPDMKAIIIDPKQLMIETAPVDWPEFLEVLSEHESELKIFGSEAERCLLVKQPGSRTQTTLFRIVTRNVAPKGEKPSMRSLWIAPWKKFTGEQLRRMIEVADTAYTYSYSVFKQTPDKEGDEETAAAPVDNRGIRVEMSMSQQLKLEQRPRLALMMSQTQTQTMNIGMGMNIQPIMTLQMKILNMTDLEFWAYVAEQKTPEEQNKLAHIIRFIMARKVRAAAMDVGKPISWKSARVIVRNLLKRGSQPQMRAVTP